MKLTYSFLLFLFCFITQAQNEFITTWQISEGNLFIEIPVDDSNFSYDYTVDFGDGTVLTNQTNDATHTYNSAGTYTVKISGTFPKFDGGAFFYNGQITSIEQWGNIQWQSMKTAFFNLYNLTINATDTPDLSNVTDMSFMFADAVLVNSPTISTWDVSNVTNMENLFAGASSFNQPLNNWNVSNVTNMKSLFADADSFNQPLNNWNVSNVTNMEGIFDDAESFNQPINNWDVSNVINMELMFNLNPYNHPLDNWDTGNVNNMSFMFSNSSFNQPLDNWDVGNVTNMSFMFSNSDFNQPLNNWDVSNVQYMGFMFRNSNFNQNISLWDVSNVTSFNSMFQNSNFNQDISSWTFNITDLGEFLSNSEMDTQNYDLLLDRFVQLGLEDGTLDADGLEYCDVFTRQVLIESQNWAIFNDELADDCSMNYISGNIRFDEDNNGCDSSDEALSQLAVNTNDGNDDLSVITNSQGDYLVTVDQGNFSVEMLNLTAFLSASPSAHAINFSNTGEIEDQKDFCITANQTVEDLSIELFPLDDARPGFESDYELIVQNNGTQTVQNAPVTVDFENTKQSFVSASQTPSNTTPNSITFTINNLPPFNSKIINFTLLNAQPPALNNGDVAIICAALPDANDSNPDDNSLCFFQTVVNSFDPNDKLVTQGEQIPDEKIDEYLDYKIRFQNVGTANAINVTITDTISNKLDWTTFQPINSSHDYRLELVNQKEINFIFENINLPYEAIDEPGSNGHVSFKIKPKDDVQIGDIIENKAYIFFDFNAPIITNTVSTEIVDNLSTTSFVQAENIKLSPNPANDLVEIINASNAVIQNLQLYTIKGQLINSFTDINLIDVSSLSSGVYILQVETQHNKINKRLIKR